MAVKSTQGCTLSLYRPRDPANTILYRVVQEHFETYLSLSTEGWDDNPVPADVEREFRRYLECGILAHGFARPLPGGWRENPLPADFSVDASVRIEGHDRAGLERLLRYCAHPPFALERLQCLDEQRLLYRLLKPRPDACLTCTHIP